MEVVSTSANKEVRTYLDPSTIYEAFFLMFRTKKVNRVDATGLLALENFLWSLILSDRVIVPYTNVTVQQIIENLERYNVDIVTPALVLEEPVRFHPELAGSKFVGSLAMAYEECRGDLRSFESALVWSKMLNINDPFLLHKRLRGSHSIIHRLYEIDNPRFFSIHSVFDKTKHSILVNLCSQKSMGFNLVAYLRRIADIPSSMRKTHHQIAYHIHRALTHLHFSEALGANYIPHPQRQPYLLWRARSSMNTICAILNQLSSQPVVDELKYIISSRRFLERVGLPLPPLTLKILREVQTREDILLHAIKIRNSFTATKLRNYLGELQELETRGDYSRWREKYHLILSSIRSEEEPFEKGHYAALAKIGLSVIPETCHPALRFLDALDLLPYIGRLVKQRKLVFVNKIRKDYIKDVVRSRELIEKFLGPLDVATIESLLKVS